MPYPTPTVPTLSVTRLVCCGARRAQIFLRCHSIYWTLHTELWSRMVVFFFLREETVILHEARSILQAVRHMECRYPSGRLCVLCDSLGLILAVYKERSQKFALLAIMRRIFACGFRAGVLFAFKWIPSRPGYSEVGSRFFDTNSGSSTFLSPPSIIFIRNLSVRGVATTILCLSQIHFAVVSCASPTVVVQS